MRFLLARGRLLVRGRPIRLLLVVSVVVLLAGGGAAFAASRSGSTIKVCVAHTSGALYKHASCHRGDSTLSWNVTGPRGPAGPPATSLWALVKEGPPPSLIYSRGVSSVSGFGTGVTLVKFSRNVSKCAFVSTVTSTGGGFFTAHPTAQISEEFYNRGWGANGKTVAVIIVDNSGTNPVSGYNFSIAAFC
ncbi:MAG: hypothetical protein ACLQFR_24085 [Streptosporangiaceae bacterium]